MQGIQLIFSYKLPPLPSNKLFHRRVMLIHECLQNNMRRWSAKELHAVVAARLQDRFGMKVSIRSIYEDLHYMREEMQAPIEQYQVGRNKYLRYSDPHFHPLNVSVSEQEVKVLRDAIRMLDQVSGMEFFEELSDIITRLESTINTTFAERRRIIQFEQNTGNGGREHIRNCFDAIKGETVIQVHYRPFFREARKFIIHPYLLKEYRNRWYLIGRKEDTENPITLALDRIEKISPTRVTFRQNDIFDPETYHQHVIGISLPHGTLPETILLHVKESQVPYLRSQPLHHSQTIQSVLEDGSVEMTIRVVINYELKSTLLSFGPSVQVMAPDSLRDEMRESHREAGS